MAIKVRAIERNVSFDKESEKWMYVMQPELYNRLTQVKVVEEASIRSGIPKGSLNASWEAIGDVIKAWATAGHSRQAWDLYQVATGVESGRQNRIYAARLLPYDSVCRHGERL